MAADSILTVLLDLLGRATPARRAVNAFKASMLAGGILLVAGLAILAAVGFGCAALWTVEDTIHGPVRASLLVSSALLVVALILVAIAWLVHRRGTKPVASTITPEQIDAIQKLVGELVGEHKTGALVAAVLAGAAAEQATRRR